MRNSKIFFKELKKELIDLKNAPLPEASPVDRRAVEEAVRREYEGQMNSMMDQHQKNIANLQKIVESLKVKLDQKEKELSGDLEKQKKEWKIQLSSTFEKDKANYDQLILTLKTEIQTHQARLALLITENTRLNELAIERLKQIDDMRVKFAETNKASVFEDRRGEMEISQKFKGEMAELKLQNDKEKNNYRLKIQQLVHLLDNKEEELKGLYQFTDERKQDVASIQSQFKKFKSMEAELQLKSQQYEHTRFEAEEAQRSRDFYAQEVERLKVLYDELVASLGKPNVREVEVITTSMKRSKK